jgi:diguanylate cyclase (GGDEF)-like protein
MERVDSMTIRKLPFSILLFDIDNFKSINDTYGHHIGDTVLEKTSSIIQEHIRPIDIAGRYGGEEFIIILREASLEEAGEVGNRIRKAFLCTDWSKDDLHVSISGGVAENSIDSETPVLHLADALMYQAKRNGKNRIERPVHYDDSNRLM